MPTVIFKHFGTSIFIVFEHPCRAKGQLISKCPFGVFKSPKKPTKHFPGFLPYPLEVKLKK